MKHTHTQTQSGPTNTIIIPTPQTRRTDGQRCRRRRQRGKKKREMQLSVQRSLSKKTKQEQKQIESVLPPSEVPGGHTTFSSLSHLFLTNPSFPTKLNTQSQCSLLLLDNQGHFENRFFVVFFPYFHEQKPCRVEHNWEDVSQGKRFNSAPK